MLLSLSGREEGPGGGLAGGGVIMGWVGNPPASSPHTLVGVVVSPKGGITGIPAPVEGGGRVDVQRGGEALPGDAEGAVEGLHEGTGEGPARGGRGSTVAEEEGGDLFLEQGNRPFLGGHLFEDNALLGVGLGRGRFLGRSGKGGGDEQGLARHRRGGAGGAPQA